MPDSTIPLLSIDGPRCASRGICDRGPTPQNRKRDQTLRVINVYAGFVLT
jgi:hypothetical protein